MNKDELKIETSRFCQRMKQKGVQVFIVCESPTTKTFHYDISAPESHINQLILKVLTAIGMAAKKVGISETHLQSYLRGRTPREKLDAQIREIGLTPISDLTRR